MTKQKLTENNLDKQSALRIMASRVLITAPGKYHVRVTNDPEALAHSGAILKELPGGTFQCSIANFAAYTPYMKKQFIAYMKQGEYDKAANQCLTRSIRSNDYMPQKNETIAITVGYVTVTDKTTNVTEEALLVTGYTALPVMFGSKLTMDQLLMVEEPDAVELQLTPENAEQF